MGRTSKTQRNTKLIKSEPLKKNPPLLLLLSCIMFKDITKKNLFLFTNLLLVISIHVLIRSVESKKTESG